MSVFQWLSRQNSGQKGEICSHCYGRQYKKKHIKDYHWTGIEVKRLSKFARKCNYCALIHDVISAADLAYNQKTGSPLLPDDWDTRRIIHTFGVSNAPAIRLDKISLHIFLLEDHGTDDQQAHPKLPVWRPVSNHAGSDACLKLAKSWLQTCLKTHTECSNTSHPEMPKRVIHIESFDAESDDFKLRLIETNGQKGSYVALSHCWGKPKSKPLTTRKESLDRRKAGIPWTKVPPTFRDAIRVTWSLGLCYIWIDSLCIIQGDALDWEDQSAQMGDIYENATLTIAASSASGHDDGILVPRGDLFTGTVMFGGSAPESHPRPACFQAFLDHYQTSHNEGVAEPLQKRAWAYQERLLSTRTLVFSTKELKWECNTLHSCECDLEKDMLQSTLSCHPYSLKKFLQASRADTLHYWYSDVVPNYSRGLLTQEMDKLPALSGVARRMQKSIGGKYVAGLWETDALKSLLWAPSGGSSLAPCPEYRAPSFCWTSVNDAVGYQSGINPPGAKVLEVSCTLEYGDPFGRIKDGRLVIFGQIIPSWILLPQDVTSGSVRISFERENPGKTDVRPIYPDTRLGVSPIRVDDDAEGCPEGSTMAVHRSNIAYTGPEKWYQCQCLIAGDAYGSMYYLVLGHSLRTSGAFERLAMVDLLAGHEWRNPAKTVLKEVTLV